MNRWMRCCALLLLSAMPAYAVETGVADDAYGSGNGYVVSAPGESAELRALARSGNRIIAGGRIGTRGLLLQRYASGRPDFTFSSTGIKALDELAVSAYYVPVPAVQAAGREAMRKLLRQAQRLPAEVQARLRANARFYGL